MGESFLWGLLAGSSLVLGGLLTFWLPIGRRALGLIMAFGAGVLISAVAFELVHEAFETTAGDGGVGLGLFLGSCVFFAGDSLIDHLAAATASTRAASKLPALRWPSCSGSFSTGFPSRSSSG